MKQFSYVIRDPEGIHARPAGLLVKEACKFESKLSISKEDKSGDLKRIFSVMGLAAKRGETITITAEGADEEQAISALESAFEQNL